MFMRVKSHFEGVSDLNFARLSPRLWPLSCCHVLRSIRPLSTPGWDSSRGFSSLCATLRRRLQGSTLLLLAAVGLLGLCPTDLARRSARHRGLSQRARRPTLSLGLAHPGQTQHPGRRAGRARLAHLRRSGPTPDRPRSEEHTSNSSHGYISYAVFCLKKKKKE